MSLLDLIKAVAPSLAQGGGLTRQGVTGLGVTLITTGASSENIPLIAAGAALWAGSAAWTVFRHSQASVADAAGQIPGVKVVVSPAIAPPSVVAVARDPAVPNVTLGRP